MAGSEPVTSPDQRKPGHRRAGQIGAVTTIALLLLMTIGGNITGTERVWLIGFATLLAAILIGDAVLRRNGLRS